MSSITYRHPVSKAEIILNIDVHIENPRAVMAEIERLNTIDPWEDPVSQALYGAYNVYWLPTQCSIYPTGTDNSSVARAVHAKLKNLYQCCERVPESSQKAVAARAEHALAQARVTTAHQLGDSLWTVPGYPMSTERSLAIMNALANPEDLSRTFVQHFRQGAENAAKLYMSLGLATSHAALTDPDAASPLAAFAASHAPSPLVDPDAAALAELADIDAHVAALWSRPDMRYPGASSDREAYRELLIRGPEPKDIDGYDEYYMDNPAWMRFCRGFVHGYIMMGVENVHGIVELFSLDIAALLKEIKDALLELLANPIEAVKAMVQELYKQYETTCEALAGGKYFKAGYLSASLFDTLMSLVLSLMTGGAAVVRNLPKLGKMVNKLGHVKFDLTLQHQFAFAAVGPDGIAGVPRLEINASTGSGSGRSKAGAQSQQGKPKYEKDKEKEKKPRENLRDDEKQEEIKRDIRLGEYSKNKVIDIRPEYLDILPEESAYHFIVGDLKGGGGHFPPEAKNKTPFPDDWSIAKIYDNTVDVGTDPKAQWRPGHIIEGKPNRWVAEAERDGVMLRVITEDGTGIVTSFPLKRVRR